MGRGKAFVALIKSSGCHPSDWKEFNFSFTDNIIMGSLISLGKYLIEKKATTGKKVYLLLDAGPSLWQTYSLALSHLFLLH